MGLTMTMIGVQLPPLVGQGLLILHLERPDLRPRRRGAGLSRLVAYWQHANVSYDKADNRRSDRLERLLRCSSPPAGNVPLKEYTRAHLLHAWSDMT